MQKIDVAGLKIDAITKQALLDGLMARIKSGQKTFVITPYSEFLYHSLEDPKLLEIFNRADFALADGIGIFWAKKYLDLPLTAKTYWGKIIQALWQLKYSLAAIIFWPRWIKSALPEKIVGADLIWDLAKLAADNHLSIYLLGGFGDTAQKVSLALSTKHPSLKISGASNKNPADPTVIDDINKSSADILLVAYGPIKQEQWIAENLSKLNIKLAIGLGGTFDYIAGKQASPPKFLRYTGLEWLWRLITQPRRLGRIINATFGLALEIFLYKFSQSLTYRKNVVSIIIKNDKTIFVGKRNPSNKNNYPRKNEKDRYLNYWQLPQGGVRETENLIAAGQREAKEETGITSLEFIKASPETNRYDFRQSWSRFYDSLFESDYRYKGQLQNIMYFKFSGNDNEIKIDRDEFINYQWVKVEELDKIVHSERINLVRIVQQDLKELV